MLLNWRFRLRPSMLGLFVLLALPLMVALVLITYTSTNEAVSRTAQAMAERFNAQVVKNIQQVIDPISSLSSSTAVMVSSEQGYFRKDASWAYLKTCIEQTIDLRGAYFAYPDGSFRATYRADGRAVFFGKEAPAEAQWAYRWLQRGPQGQAKDQIHFVNAKGDILEERNIEVPYDPRKRPWFEASVNKKKANLIGPTVFASSGQVGLTFSAPVYVNGEIAGVVGMDMTLQSLGKFLNANRISENSLAVIIDRDQKVVATSSDDDALVKLDGQLLVPALSDLRSSLPRKALASLPAKDHVGVFLFGNQEGKQDHLALLSPIPLKAHGDWKVLVIAPRSDFLSDIVSNIGRITILGVILLGLQVLMVWWLSRKIAGPLEALALQVDAIERLEINDAYPLQRSSFTEIDRLAQSVSRMSKALKAFAAFVPIDLVRGLMKSEKGLETGGHSRFITIMFTDLEAFSALSENRPSHELLQQVSRYLGTASRIIGEEFGTVDKFIGDAVMAFWGAPNELEDHAWRACVAAVRIQQEMDIMNAEWKKAGLPELKVRIGIHSDAVLVGNIGSIERMSYTVMGDGVNVASRLEGLNKNFGTRICISKTVYRESGERLILRPLGDMEVKGRKSTIEVFELQGLIGQAT
ncbi:MAG: HAMP domain-containing protein [Betaproteobacteria bacterium]|nr:HAMP domain-containing protein [Betaproteobacteria bacterium]